jgi:hypothetical protein
MDKGEIVERGVYKAWLERKGLYCQLWEKQPDVALSANKTIGTFKPIWFKFSPILFVKSRSYKPVCQ